MLENLEAAVTLQVANFSFCWRARGSAERGNASTMDFAFVRGGGRTTIRRLNGDLS